jgi:hypothetical protein
VILDEELDLAALYRLIPPELWLAYVATPRPEPGRRGRCGAVEADVLAGEIGAVQ